MENLDLPALDSYSYKPLRKQVYEVLREAILTGNLKPGQKITEVKIAEKLNVSRTPVREAIRMLELEELVVIVPQRGKFVAGVKSKKEINEIFQVRTELEGLAAYLATQKIGKEDIERMSNFANEIKECIRDNDLERCVEIDIAFHDIIYEVSDNQWLQKFLDNLFEQITRFRSKSLSRSGRMKEALEEHKELSSAIEKGEAEKARNLAREHVENARKSILSVFENKNEKEE